MSEAPAETSSDILIELKRTAIDSSGRLGSLYDGYRDRLVEQLIVVNQEQCQSNRKVQGEIKYGNDDQPQNLLRRLSVNEQLRLSILLNLTPSGGIASLIDYSHLANEYTRLFCYSYVDRIQQLPDRIEDARQLIHSSMSSTIATHVITGIEWGIDLVVVLRLSSDENISKEIDHVLEKLLTSLLNDNNACILTPDEESLLERIIYTKVYANTPYLNNLTTVYGVCRCIKENDSHLIDYPISYTLRPIKWLHPQYDGEGSIFTPLSIELNDQIEDYVLQLIAEINNLEVSVIENTPKVLDEPSEQRLLDIQKQWLDVKDKFMNEIKRLSKIVIELRSGRDGNLVDEDVLNNGEQRMLKDSINDLTQNLNDLKEKKQFPYPHVIEPDIDVTDVEIPIADQLPCSKDSLEKSNADESPNLYSVSEEQPKIDSVCVNGSKNTLDSSDTPSHEETQESINAHMPYSSPAEPQSPTLPPTDVDIPNTSAHETINILLLGETGVGKSTFINAFANYLTFNTLQQAETGQPVVLIPVSFLITVGDNFDEYIVKFGDVDGLKNEDFEHPGQSVTQRCRSYVFNLNHTDGKKLRIIDTPGFGDTRGLEQDDCNMEHILAYIKNLSHVDAICFLLKPNESRLNIFYRSCLLQLCSVLKSNSCDNIIFGFTNARSTFYTPGDTAPLLKKMLISLPMNNISFKKENTFCFDSESFRYLVALQNGIKFNDIEREEYEMSWTKSVAESNRLVRYICDILIPHRMQEEEETL